MFLGDVATGSGTVAAAVGSGRQVAYMVDHYLRGSPVPEEPPSLPSLWPRRVNVAAVADAHTLNLAYFSVTPPRQLPELPAELSPEWAVEEARRCLACGACNGCLNCFYWCPDLAIHGEKAGLTIDLDHCKGCGYASRNARAAP